MSETQQAETSANGLALKQADIPLTPGGNGAMSLQPRSFSEILRVANLMASSSMVPKDFVGRPENCAIAIMWGLELGLSALQAIQNIAVVNGRPSLWGTIGTALIRKHPEFESIEEYDICEDGTKATPGAKVFGAVCIMKRKGQVAQVRSFTMRDAQTAELLGKDTWKKYAPQMMRWRAKWQCIDDVFPDALHGLAGAEVMQDIAPAIAGEFRVVPESERNARAEAEPIRQPQRKPAAEAPAPAAADVVTIADGDGGVIDVDPSTGEIVAASAVDVVQSLAALDDFEEAARADPADVAAVVIDALFVEPDQREAADLAAAAQSLQDAATKPAARQTAQEPQQATLVPPATDAKPAVRSAPAATVTTAGASTGKLSQGQLKILEGLLRAKAKTTTWIDLVQHLGGDPVPATFSRAVAWIEARPDA